MAEYDELHGTVQDQIDAGVNGITRDEFERANAEAAEAAQAESGDDGGEAGQDQPAPSSDPGAAVIEEPAGSPEPEDVEPQEGGGVSDNSGPAEGAMAQDASERQADGGEQPQ